MTKETDLAAAKIAVKTVQSRMIIGASDKPFTDYPTSYRRYHETIEKQVGDTYADWDWLKEIGGLAAAFMPAACILKADEENRKTEPRSPLQYVQMLARVTERLGCGNCGGQSALAFKELYDVGIRPLDWMWLTNMKHAFVVIGKATGGTIDPSTWGPDAVICDPWKGDSYPLPAEKAKDLLLHRMEMRCTEANSKCRVG
jgi:hypothetical protein